MVVTLQHQLKRQGVDLTPPLPLRRRHKKLQSHDQERHSPSFCAHGRTREQNDLQHAERHAAPAHAETACHRVAATTDRLLQHLAGRKDLTAPCAPHPACPSGLAGAALSLFAEFRGAPVAPALVRRGTAAVPKRRMKCLQKAIRVSERTKLIFNQAHKIPAQNLMRGIFCDSSFFTAVETIRNHGIQFYINQYLS